MGVPPHLGLIVEAGIAAILRLLQPSAQLLTDLHPDAERARGAVDFAERITASFAAPWANKLDMAVDLGGRHLLCSEPVQYRDAKREAGIQDRHNA
jgi:hypothetical protein